MDFKSRIEDLIDYDFCQPFKIVTTGIGSNEIYLSKQKAVMSVVRATLEASNILQSISNSDKADEILCTPYVITLANAAMCSAGQIVEQELTTYIDSDYKEQYAQAIDTISTTILQKTYERIIQSLS